MTSQRFHDSNDDPFARVLFFSVFLHYIIFLILFGNPFLLNWENGRNPPSLDRRFEVHLLNFPGMGDSRSPGALSREKGLKGLGSSPENGRHPPKIKMLGLFPQEVSGEEVKNRALKEQDAEALGNAQRKTQNPSEIPDLKFGITNQTLKQKLKTATLNPEGKDLLSDEPLPMVTTKKPPPNMTGPADCMIKVVGMVCPNGDPKCIVAYTAFCASLPK